MMKRKTKKIINGVVVVAVLSLAVVLFCWVRNVCRESSQKMGVVLLAAAVYVYSQEYGAALPDNLETILQTGLYGLDSGYSVEGGNVKIRNVPVSYVSTSTPGVVVACFYFHNGEVGYVISGDTGSHFTDSGKIGLILAEDNEKRKKNNEPRLWPLK